MLKNIKFALVLILQTLIILGLILFKVAVLKGGTDVYLKILPIDPRDPLRGDYVTFQYEISSAYDWNFSQTNEMKVGDEVYVPLRHEGKHWSIAYDRTISKQKPQEGIFIKGVIISGFEDKNRQKPPLRLDGGEIGIRFGIEEYFIPEGTGRTLDFSRYEVSALVTIDDSGTAVLKRLYLDGSPWPE